MKYDTKDRVCYMLTKLTFCFNYRKLKIIKHLNEMNMEKKLFPLHKQSIAIKDQCCKLLKRYFEKSFDFDMLVYISFKCITFFVKKCLKCNSNKPYIILVL